MRARHIAAAVITGALLAGGSGAVALAATAGVPQYQTGEVHSCTTNGRAPVDTYNGGITWVYEGQGGPGTPYLQDGVVHSFYTGGNADVGTNDGGLTWEFEKEPFLFCSPP